MKSGQSHLQLLIDVKTDEQSGNTRPAFFFRSMDELKRKINGMQFSNIKRAVIEPTL